MGDTSCPSCAARLTKARFRPSLVLLYGAVGTVVACVVALLVVPLTVLGALVALLAREKLHVVRFEDPDDEILVD